MALDRLIANGLSSRLMGTRSQNTNTPPKPSYFSPNSALELAAGESGLKASGNSGEVPKRSSGLLRLVAAHRFRGGRARDQ
jgi:hypothetical protein